MRLRTREPRQDRKVATVAQFGCAAVVTEACPIFEARFASELFSLPSLSGPTPFGGGFELLPGSFRNDPLRLGLHGRQRARRSTTAAGARGRYAGDYLDELFALRRQVLDLTINAGNRHFDMLSGIAAC